MNCVRGGGVFSSSCDGSCSSVWRRLGDWFRTQSRPGSDTEAVATHSQSDLHMRVKAECSQAVSTFDVVRDIKAAVALLRNLAMTFGNMQNFKLKMGHCTHIMAAVAVDTGVVETAGTIVADKLDHSSKVLAVTVVVGIMAAVAIAGTKVVAAAIVIVIVGTGGLRLAALREV